MIKLRVESYCDNCPNFEPSVQKQTVTPFDDALTVTNTFIYCANRCQCEEIKKYLKTVKE